MPKHIKVPNVKGPTKQLCYTDDAKHGHLEKCDRVIGHAGPHVWQAHRDFVQLQEKCLALDEAGRQEQAERITAERALEQFKAATLELKKFIDGDKDAWPVTILRASVDHLLRTKKWKIVQP